MTVTITYASQLRAAALKARGPEGMDKVESVPLMYTGLAAGHIYNMDMYMYNYKRTPTAGGDGETARHGRGVERGVLVTRTHMYLK